MMTKLVNYFRFAKHSKPVSSEGEAKRCVETLWLGDFSLVNLERSSGLLRGVASPKYSPVNFTNDF